MYVCMYACMNVYIKMYLFMYHSKSLYIYIIAMHLSIHTDHRASIALFTCCFTFLFYRLLCFCLFQFISLSVNLVSSIMPQYNEL